jgi:urocanate hydratase
MCTNQAGNIAGCVTVCAEVNPKITSHSFVIRKVGLMKSLKNVNELVTRVSKALENKETVPSDI